MSCCPHPFDGRRIDYAVPAGLSIAEIIAAVQPDPVLRAHGVAFIGAHAIPRQHWHRVRPSPGAFVSLRLLPGGGGGARIAAMVGIAVLAIGLAVAAPYLAPVLASGLNVSAATAGAIVAGGTAAIVVGATLAVNLLLPPPLPETSNNSGIESQAYQIVGARNRAAYYEKVPFICGRFLVTPPYAALPYREVIGNDTYWRVIFALGHGPLQIEALRIGETALENYQEVEWELRRGFWSLADQGEWDPTSGVFPEPAGFADTWTAVNSATVNGKRIAQRQTITYNGLGPTTDPDAWDLDQGRPLALYPADVHEDTESIALTYSDGPQLRTTVAGADEISIELLFERLVHLQNSPPGKLSSVSVLLKIEQSPAGRNQWSTAKVLTVTGRQQTPLYAGHRWKPAEYGPIDAIKRYDVRITRLTGDTDEQRTCSKSHWTVLRSITAADPVRNVRGVTLVALRIRATGQLQGTIDAFKAICRSIARDWDATTGRWVWRPTASPAALLRQLLQHPARATPATDAEIDLQRLADWDGLIRQHRRFFNGIFDAKTALFDALARLCRIGRARLTRRELLHSVIIDEPRTTPVNVFSPRNSWDYDGEISHAPLPHGYRIGFVNEAAGWKVEEIVVYDDGYTAESARVIDRVEIVGITDRDQAWREGRYHLAQQRLRREIHHLVCDIEQLACEAGDLVALSHDVIAVGIAAARVVARTLDGGVVRDVTLDAPVTLQTSRHYGLRVRRVVAGVLRTDLYRLQTVAGTTPRLRFAEPPAAADAPAVGDLAAFGVFGRETLRVLVRDIEPRDAHAARLTLIAEAPGVHVAEQGVIPAYDPVITPPAQLPPPTVIEVISDETMLSLTPSRALLERLLFRLAPIAVPGAEAHVAFRLTGTQGGWQTAVIQEQTDTSVIIAGPRAGETYDFRLQYTHATYHASLPTQINGHTVIGRLAPPAPLQNLSLASVGGQALLQWDLPADLDVQAGGWIVFRHSPEMDAASWPNASSLARSVAGDLTHLYLPLKPGTYFARSFDAGGRASDQFASVSTGQAALLAFVPVGAVVEHPVFAGSKVNCEVVDDALQLIEDSFDAVPDTDALADWDDPGGVARSGLYRFAAGIDAGSVRRMRITSHVLLVAFSASDFWDDRIGLIDDWSDVDGSDGITVDASVWGRLTDDDPAGTPTWGPLMRIDAADVTCRAIGQIECRMCTEDRLGNLQISELRVIAEEVASA